MANALSFICVHLLSMEETTNSLFSVVESILESHLDAIRPEVCANMKPSLLSTQLILHDF